MSDELRRRLERAPVPEAGNMTTGALVLKTGFSPASTSWPSF